MLKDKSYHKIYLAVLSGIGFFLPLSEWLLSCFTILLAIFWIADKGYKQLPLLFTTRKTVLLAMALYFVPVIWMLNTSEISYGLHDLLIKLPLLVFPLVIGLRKPVSENETRIVISVFIAGVMIASLIAVFKLWGTPFSEWSANRDSALFISHIRLALMINLALFASVWFMVKDNTDNKIIQYFYLASSIWLVFFLVFLLSLTGLILLVILSAGSIIYFAISTRNKIVRYVLLPLIVIIGLTSAIFIVFQVKSFYTIVEPIPQKPDQITINRNPYTNYPERKDVENGRYVWMYICEEEMAREWNKRSNLDYFGPDKKDQDLRYTLIRYLTSAGFRKDSLGVSSLSESDIEFVENGIANKMFTEGSTIKSMIYNVVWQIDYYRRGGNPSGHSVTQRIEYFRTGLRIFLKYPVAGVGTGDVPVEFARQYERDASVLEPQFRNRAHNQYLTFLISSGLAGFILILLSVAVPITYSGSYRNYIFIVFISIALISMLTEDTLETHAGVTFFAYFYSLLIFGTRIKDN